MRILGQRQKARLSDTLKIELLYKICRRSEVAERNLPRASAVVRSGCCPVTVTRASRTPVESAAARMLCSVGLMSTTRPSLAGTTVTRPLS